MKPAFSLRAMNISNSALAKADSCLLRRSDVSCCRMRVPPETNRLDQRKVLSRVTFCLEFRLNDADKCLKSRPVCGLLTPAAAEELVRLLGAFCSKVCVQLSKLSLAG